MAKRVTLDDVADHAGVSKATVSAVVNNKPTVKHSTKDKVVEAIEELGYHSQKMTTRLRGIRQKSIGLIIKESRNPYYEAVALDARSYASENGYALFVASSEGSHEQEGDLVTLAHSLGVAGLILSPVLSDDGDLTYLFELNRNNFPLVLLEKVRGLQTDIVRVDEVENTRHAAKYLIDHGHTKIVHFSGPAYSTPSQDRIDGFRLAFSDSPLRFENEFVIPTGAYLEDGLEKARAFFKEKSADERPTAVICYNDLVAIGVYRALCELGIKVPEDVSIIGHDDIEILPYFPTPLSSVHTPNRETGRKAAELLIRRIQSDRSLPPETVVIESELAIRQSVRSLETVS